jgi:hypothetical protein
MSLDPELTAHAAAAVGDAIDDPVAVLRPLTTDVIEFVPGQWQ